MKVVLGNFGHKIRLRLEKTLVYVALLCTLHFALCAIPLSIEAAHTYHTSLTRIDYDEKEKLAEISIQLFTHDVVPVLEKYSKKNVNLEKTTDVDKIILDYLSENFVLRNTIGQIKKLNWVGKEVKTDTIFVYLEIPLETDFDGFELQNTIFFESFPEQTNLVIARFNGKKADLVYKAGDKSKAIRESNSAEGKN